MPASIANRERAARVDAPGPRTVRSALREYIERSDATHAEIGERIGYSEKAVAMFIENIYGQVAGTDAYIRAALWEFLQRSGTTAAVRRSASGRLFQTENVRRIARYFTAAAERGEVCLLYGPPGTQKTFALEHLVAAREREKKHDACYVYASDRMTATSLVKRIGREAGARIAFTSRERILNSILHVFAERPRPPAVVIDEAQHLDVHCLEVLRELHDRSGCGLVLAGSHNLFENFLRGRQHLEQWLSRIDHKDPLPGLQESEVAEIAARELGNGQPAKLSEKKVHALVAACQVDDVFSRDANGRPAVRKYLSVRRLVKVLAQTKQEHAA